MDWKSRIREAVNAQGHSVSEDIVEELAAHAAAFYQSRINDGCASADAEQDTQALIISLCEKPDTLNRRARQLPPPTPPVSGPRPFVGLVHDMRYALQIFRRRPGFTALSILTMSLGIGLMTTLFNLAYGVLWKPLPWPEPDRLVRMTEIHEGATRPHRLQMGNGAYLAWQDQPSTIDALAGYWTGVSTLTGIGDADRITIGHCTATLFSVLRAKPLLGSLFTPNEEAAGDKVVLSYAMWQERFGGNPAALGKLIYIDRTPFTVTAVMPQDFAFPDRSIRVWVPYNIRPVIGKDGRSTSTQIFGAIARLRPNASLAQAAAEATARARSAPDGGLATMAFWGSNPGARVNIEVIPALEALTSEIRPVLIMIVVAAALLLITAIGNVASLQLARALSRQREVAIRSALGAGVRRIVQQFIIESLLLGIAGGAGALLLTMTLHRALPSLLPADFPRVDDVVLNIGMTVFACVLALAASLVVGVLPALYVLRINLVESLIEDGNASIGGTHGRLPRVRTAIMVGQIAIACVLLVGAALLERSFAAMNQANRGYDPAGLLTANIPMPAPAFTSERQVQILDAIMERIRALPSVNHAAYGDRLPLNPGETISAFNMPSNRPPVGDIIQVHSVRFVVSENYFSTLGIRFTSGREFNSNDVAASSKVVVVNRSFAKQYLSDAAIGDRIVNFAGSNAKGEYEVVGIIDDVLQHGLNDPIQPEIYSLQHQTTFRSSMPGLIVRTNGDPRALINDLRSIVREQDSTLALDSVMTMEDRVASTLARPRLYAVLFGVFAISALVIATVGLFGVLSYSVSNRFREFALRAALGARPANVMGLVLKQGMAMTVSGLVLGILFSVAGMRYLSGLLYGVTSHDWISFSAVTVVIATIAGAACVLPALRALRVDPIRALIAPRS